VDLERIISKVAVGRVSPREVVQLKVALQAIEPIKQACMEADNASLNRIGEQLNYPCKDSGFSAENQRYAPIQFSK
jgi:DNA mismatch repair ATPase MutS